MHRHEKRRKRKLEDHEEGMGLFTERAKRGRRETKEKKGEKVKRREVYQQRGGDEKRGS